MNISDVRLEKKENTVIGRYRKTFGFDNGKELAIRLIQTKKLCELQKTHVDVLEQIVVTDLATINECKEALSGALHWIDYRIEPVHNNVWEIKIYI